MEVPKCQLFLNENLEAMLAKLGFRAGDTVIR